MSATRSERASTSVSGYDVVRAWCGAAAFWSLLLVVAVWALPVVSIDNGEAGPVPRYSIADAGDRLATFVFLTPIAVTLVVWALLELAPFVGRAGWMVRWAAMSLSAMLAVAAFTAFITILIGIAAIPAAVLLCVASGVALRSRADA